MDTKRRFPITTLVAVALAAMVLGMVLTGGLGVTPQGSAERVAAGAAAPAEAPGELAPPAGYPDFAALAERVMPAVISVLTTDTVTRSDMRQFHRDVDPFEFFFGPNMSPEQMRPRVRRGAGSGFFIGEDGLAITNNHVVEGADKIEVRLASDDNVKYPATVVGRDPATDLALIRVEGKSPFSPLKLGNSAAAPARGSSSVRTASRSPTTTWSRAPTRSRCGWPATTPPSTRPPWSGATRPPTLR